MKKWIAVMFFVTLGLMLITNSCENTAKPYQVYKIDQTVCIQCHTCVPKCGYGAISYSKTVRDPLTDEIIQQGKVQIDPKKCVGCGECYIACPYGAIYGTLYDGATGATTKTGGGEGEGDD